MQPTIKKAESERKKSEKKEAKEDKKFKDENTKSQIEEAKNVDKKLAEDMKAAQPPPLGSLAQKSAKVKKFD